MTPTTVKIPLVGGPADGTTVLVLIGPDGRPSLTLCVPGDDGLSAAPVYELESDDSYESAWCYRFRAESTTETSG